MVITGNSRLLMPNVPITLWYVTPSLSYPDYVLSFAVSSFQYFLNPSLIPNESLYLLCLCFSLVSAIFYKALWFELLWLKLELGEDSGTSLVNRKSSFSFLKKSSSGSISLTQFKLTSCCQIKGKLLPVQNVIVFWKLVSKHLLKWTETLSTGYMMLPIFLLVLDPVTVDYFGGVT